MKRCDLKPVFLKAFLLLMGLFPSVALCGSGITYQGRGVVGFAGWVFCFV